MKDLLAIDDLTSIVSKGVHETYIEARYQSRLTNEVNFSNGELERIRTGLNAGCGIRVLVDGCWGFSSTNDFSKSALREALHEARAVAKILALTKKNKVKGLAKISNPVTGLFNTRVKGDLHDIDIEKKVKITKEAESDARRYSSLIKSVSCTYHEILDHKIIVNSDGVKAELYESRPEFSVTSVAMKEGDRVVVSEGRGISGGWEDLFREKDHLDYANMASKKALNLLDAKQVAGEKTTIILDPGMVGLIAHEAIGHMVEADFVLSGSITKDKIGQKVASEKVTLVDSGQSNNAENAAGSIAVDDEGVVASRTVIIEKGFLKSFLHNRETAFLFGSKPTGNARAFEYNDEPLIRMRNTFIEPGSERFSDMIKETRHGYLVKGARNGQADANGEFMFGFQEMYSIEKGEIKELLRGASISGSAFEVLKSVDMVANDFRYDIGTGYCGKYQPAKVDGGGPHIRCTAIVGGLQ